MQIHDLVKTIDQMSREELLEHVRAMRHRREVARPVAKQKVARAEKKATVVRDKKTTTLLSGMSPEELLKLMEQLGG